jgi:hypothetical protein
MDVAFPASLLNRTFVESPELRNYLRHCRIASPEPPEFPEFLPSKALTKCSHRVEIIIVHVNNISAAKQRRRGARAGVKPSAIIM